MRSCVIVVSLVGALLLVPLFPAFAGNEGGAANLEKLIEEAISHNPDLKAADEKVQAFGEKPPQEESLDNPRVGFGLMNLPLNSFSYTQEPMTQKQVSVIQKLPFPGKLALKGDIARKDVDIVREEFLERRNNLVMQVKTVYRNLLLIDKTIEITEKNRDLIREFVRTAETRYSVGMGIQQDVLKARVELSKMIDMLISLGQKKTSLLARLNALLYRPSDGKMTDVESGDIDSLKPTEFSYTSDELEEIAVGNRPVLIGARQRIERSQLAVRLAKRNYYPDFDVGMSYGQREGRPDFLSGFVTISIPLWHKNREDRKVAEERAMARQAEEQYDAMKNDVFFKISDSTSEIKKYREQIDLLKTGLIPQSKAALESAIAGYGVNKVDFVTLVNNLLTSYNYEIEYYRALTNYENMLAEIEATVGKRLF
jgi:cobalt-zinc-cadmium efflux system outer membrane protein